MSAPTVHAPRDEHGVNDEDDDRLARPSMARLAAEIRPHRRGALVVLALVMAATIVELSGPLLLAVAIDDGVLDGKRGVLQACAVGYAALTAALAGLHAATVVRTAVVAQRYLRGLRDRLVDRLHVTDLAYFERTRSGKVVARLTSDVENIQVFTDQGVHTVARAGVLLSFTAVAMLIQSVRLTLVIGLALGPALLAVRIYRRRAHPAQLRVRDRVGNLLGHLNESLLGMRVVRAYGLEDLHRERFTNANESAYEARRSVALLNLLYYPVVDLTYPVLLAVTIAYGGFLASNGDMSAGAVVAFSLYVGRLFEPLVELAEMNEQVQAAGASFTRLTAFLDAPVGVVDADDAQALVAGAGRVELDGVSFRYQGAQTDALRAVTVTIAPGERIALVGASGAGKSTMARLLVRQYDPTAGRVLLDGQDLRSVTRESLRGRVVLAPQEGFLFDGTIASNVSLARPEATPREIAEACRAVGITLDLSVEVGDRGRSLSAGQRQLVGLARVVLARPTLLVLDEATASLDADSELAVDLALASALNGCTAVVIAHRIATALRADRVILVDNGEIAEDGSPEELAAAGGRFTAWIAGVGDAAQIPST